MSHYLRIFCRSTEPILRDKITNFIIDHAFFDEDPCFEPPAHELQAGGADWNTLIIRYDAERRPIVLDRNVGDDVLRGELKELFFILERSRDTKARQMVLDHLRSTAQIIVIDLDPQGTTDDCWEMLDSLEAFICREYDGMLYEQDVGFFDKNLKKFYKL